MFDILDLPQNHLPAKRLTITILSHKQLHISTATFECLLHRNRKDQS
jgi:hypothetical protein